MGSAFVSTAIPYVNADPHIGFAQEAVVADAIARLRRARGDDVFFLTGTDDNSLKSVRAARKEGVRVSDLVGRYRARFESLRQLLNLSTDDFIATSTDPRHRVGVLALWRACADSGDVYRGTYAGRYCVGCERFLDDDELQDGRCPEHLEVAEHVEEENWFFRLSRYADPLRRLIDGGEVRILPDHRRDEVLALIDSGLRDFSISRSSQRALGWGIGVPGDPGQVTYVWFDALGNYVNALGYGADDASSRERLDRYWSGAVERVHVIGKDIVRFHAVSWPAILLSAGLAPPTTILAHGFVTTGGRKIAKSAANAVDPFALVSEFGTDVVRYFLLRHIRTTEDGDFTRDRLVAVRDADLADQLGNLVSRVVALVRRSLDGSVPAPPPVPALGDVVTGARRAHDDAASRFHFHEALEAIWTIIRSANAYVVEAAPWNLAHTDPRLRDVLGELCAALRTVARLLVPYLPDTADAILLRVGEPGRRVGEGGALFPKRPSEPADSHGSIRTAGIPRD